MPETDAIRSLRRKLDAITYPATREEILDRVGNEAVSLRGETRKIRDLLERVRENRFASEDELLARVRAATPELQGPTPAPSPGTPEHGSARTPPGLAQIRRELVAVDFPATRVEMLNRVGGRTVTLQGEERTMRDLLERIPEDRYQNEEDLLNRLRADVPELGPAGEGPRAPGP